MGMYLGYWPTGGGVYSRRLETEEDQGICGVCHKRSAAWGDWMCSRCRAEFEAELRMETDEEVDGAEEA